MILPKLPLPKLPIPLPLPDPKKIWEKAKKIARVIFSDDEPIRYRESYNTERNTAADIMELNTALNDCRAAFRESFDELESSIKKECVNTIDGIIEMINGINASVRICNSASMKRQFMNIADDIEGTAMEHMRKRISLDDPECAAVLRLPAGELKGNRMKELKKKVYTESVDIVSEKLRRSFRSILDNFIDTVEEKISEAEINAEEKKKNFEIISDSSQENIAVRESAVMQYAFLECVGELGENIISGGNE